MGAHRIVSREQWLEARRKHLAEEKAFTRQRDALSAARRELPWTRVEKDYVFDTTSGPESLADLFAGRNQLVVYHFMFHPDWEQGCKSCSFLADSYAGAVVHLAARDVTLVTVSKAPVQQIEAFRQRMGWNFKWVSSGGNDFNRDFHVSFTEQELANDSAFYNYRNTSFPEVEAPGISAFALDETGRVCHTYSSYGRGLDMFITAYHLLDIVPNGRNEQDLPYSMAWIRHHDRYDDDSDAFH